MVNKAAKYCLVLQDKETKTKQFVIVTRKLSGTQVSQLVKLALSTLANTLSLINSTARLEKPTKVWDVYKVLSTYWTLSLAHRIWHKGVRSVKYLSKWYYFTNVSNLYFNEYRIPMLTIKSPPNIGAHTTSRVWGW